MADARGELALLHRRAGFGARPAELDAAVRLGYPAAVDALLAASGRPDPGAATPPALPTLSKPAAKTDPTARKAYAKALREQTEALGGWWLGRMVGTTDPVTEKLTFFWHGHFATSIQKVRSPALMLRQNELLRSKGRGPFDALALAVAEDPAMLIWLDAGQNDKAHANENFSRELLELFTLGVGNYSEADVRAAARCFTGWRANRTTGVFRVAKAQHDDGTKTVLGETGNLDGQDVVRLVSHAPAGARWVCSRLWSRFTGPVGPTDPAVAALVPAYGPALDVGAAVRAMLLSPGFRSSGGRLVTQPVEYVVGVLRALGLTVGAAGSTGPTSPTRLLATLTALGQVPFAPPSVGGWPAQTAWLTSAASLARSRFAAAVAAKADLKAIADEPRTARVDAVARLLAVSGWSARTRSALTAADDDPARLVTLALLSPEYVVS